VLILVSSKEYTNFKKYVDLSTECVCYMTSGNLLYNKSYKYILNKKLGHILNVKY